MIKVLCIGPKLKKDPLFSRKGADLSKNSAPRFNRVVRLNLANKIGQLHVQAIGKHFPKVKKKYCFF